MAEGNEENKQQAVIAPEVQAGSVVAPAGETQPAPEPEAPDASQQDGYDGAPPQEVTWTASEFIAHDKSGLWYVLLAMLALLVAAGIYFATKDFMSVAVIIVGAAVFGAYAARKPRELEYKVDDSGITIGQKHYSYSDFRSFSVMPEGAFSSIMFMPLKRFSPPLSIYYAPEDENKIIALLADRLPFEERGHDMVDRLMRRIRF